MASGRHPDLGSAESCSDFAFPLLFLPSQLRHSAGFSPDFPQVNLSLTLSGLFPQTTRSGLAILAHWLEND